MTEVKKDTYVFTIENSETDTKITSVKKGEDELKLPQGGINLDDEQNASAKLTEAINPTQQAETSEEQNNGVSQAPKNGINNQENADTPSPAEETAKEAAKQELLTTKLKGYYQKYTLGGLLNRLNNPTEGSHKAIRQELANYINENLEKGSWVGAERKNIPKDINNFQPEKGKIQFQKDSKKGEYTVILGGNHHTRKRTHKPRNAKSNTRKGHIYRTNRRRTHGKSSAHGKKQTRRNVNH